MSKKYKILLVLLIFLFVTLITAGIGVTYAFYETTITGAVSNKTADFEGEIQVVSETHTILPAASVAVDEVKFYIKNYTGTDSSPTNLSEVFLRYTLSFTLPTWGSGCSNPISYKLYSVDESNNSETEITLSNNQAPAVNFNLISAERDYYKLKVYWNTNLNNSSCYAGKSGNYGISAVFNQNPSKYTVN